MTNIVVWSAFSTSAETVAARFPDDRVLAIGDEKGLAAAVDAEVAFSGNNPRRVRQLLDATPKLRWYHTVSAGVENMPLPELAQRGIVLTNNSGSYDIQIAEHLMAFVFAASRQLHRYRDSQRAREWKEQPHQELRDATMVVYGMGSIGGEIARLASAIGMRVIGVRRKGGSRASGVDRVVAAEQLAEVVGEADYLAIAAPLTPATRGAVSREVISRMRPTAWIMNIARGGIVDEPAMIEALQAKRIGGAALDVFTTEPLPKDSPLWMLDNVGVEEPSRRARAYVPRALCDAGRPRDDADSDLRIDGGDDLHAPRYLRPGRRGDRARAVLRELRAGRRDLGRDADLRAASASLLRIRRGRARPRVRLAHEGHHRQHTEQSDRPCVHPGRARNDRAALPRARRHRGHRRDLRAHPLRR